MSQQLNLLPAEKFGASPAVIALSVWALVLLGLLAIWGVNHFRIIAAEEKLAATEGDLKQARAALQQRIDAKLALVAQIEATRPLAAAAQDLLKKMEDVGSTAGFSGYFSTLADGTEEGLWLTKVDMGKSRISQVEGRALSSEGVMRFSRNLNTLFATQGIQFTSVELTPETVAPADGRPPLSSTRFVIR